MLGFTALRLPGVWHLRLAGTSAAEIQKHRDDLERQRARLQTTIERIDMFLNGNTHQTPEALDIV